MSDKNVEILASPGFLVSLFVLLLNDFILKEQFHSVLTGKLSDFAGLFVFPLFWAAFLPRRKSLIYLLTAFLFIFWKSAYSQPLIEVWDNLPFFSIARTVDYSDFAALVVLPFSYAYGRRPFYFRMQYPALCSIAIVSLFAFTATQFSQKVPYANEYQFQTSKKELMVRMSHLPANKVLSSFWEAETFKVHFESCQIAATVNIRERDKQTVLALQEMDYRCMGEFDKQKMLETFEKEFIDKLREEPVKKSSKVVEIYEASPPSSPHSPSPTP
ncbi:MAG: hypothetical protein QOE77_1922 [Blastocatellia bacterium]|jgi:hypothetical protein|nr:hypothetical protein [Blastocatellia bacterium]